MVIKSYTYSDRAEGETQYDVAGYGNEKIVPAHYIPALVPMDKGNPFIEALPLPRTDEEIKQKIAYNARVIVQDGTSYDEKNKGQFIRLCIASPRPKVMEALKRIAKEFKNN